MDSFASRKCKPLPDAYRVFLAELLGTFILLMFGIGSVAQVVLGKGNFGGMLSINFGWGLGVVFGAYWSAGVSGGHLNPAVTLAMVVAGRTPAKKLPVYWGAQFLGSFIASAVCFGLYYDLLVRYEKGGDRDVITAWIWTTHPTAGVSTATSFFDQLVGTALLVGTIFALTDSHNNGPPANMLPLLVGFLVVGIGTSFGINCGYGINPARDLIPRIFTAIAGWGAAPFKYQSYWFWSPVIGQLVGGVVGAFVYVFAVEMHHVRKEGKLESKESTLLQTHTTFSV